jgi:hypothetical protein
MILTFSSIAIGSTRSHEYNDEILEIFILFKVPRTLNRTLNPHYRRQLTNSVHARYKIWIAG